MSDHTYRTIVGGTMIFAAFCLFAWVAPALRSDWILWREKRAIAKRKRDDDFWRVMGLGPETRRVPNSHLDPARRTGQYDVGRSVYSDVQGLHK